MRVLLRKTQFIYKIKLDCNENVGKSLTKQSSALKPDAHTESHAVVIICVADKVIFT